MKLRIWAAIIIFISSYSPLALILLIKDLDKVTWTLRNPIIAISILAIAAISVFVLSITTRVIRQGDVVTLTRVSSKSGELVNYTIPYMISFFGFDLGDWRELSAFIVFMLLMCMLTIRTQNIFINPILALQGYGLYDVEFKEGAEIKQAIFLSRNELHSGENCLIRRLSYFLYFVTETNPKD
jgi:hypothetical protein